MNIVPAIRIDRVPHSPFVVPFAVFPFLEQFAEYGQSVAAVAAVVVVVAAVDVVEESIQNRI